MTGHNGPMANRDKYRHLPPPIDPADTVETTDAEPAEVETGAVPDSNAGAAPYLRTTLGPWVR